MNKYVKHYHSKLILIAVFSIVISVLSCTKGGGLDGVRGNIYAVTGYGGGAQVIPASNSTGLDSLNGLLDAGANTFTYTMKWTALWTAPVKDTITRAVFYSTAVAGQNGDSAKNLFISAGKMLNATDSVTNSVSGNLGLSDKQKDDMIAGKWYYTIFTKKYPNGIVRAQLSATQKY